VREVVAVVVEVDARCDGVPALRISERRQVHLEAIPFRGEDVLGTNSGIGELALEEGVVCGLQDGTAPITRNRIIGQRVLMRRRLSHHLILRDLRWPED
jgi:hypothetical protein